MTIKTNKKKVATIETVEQGSAVVKNVKRFELMTLSNQFKSDVQSGLFPSVNTAILAHYQSLGHENLKTLKQWNEEGKKVRKGEKALPIWAKPIESDDIENPKYFPMAYLFSELQVEEEGGNVYEMPEIKIKYSLNPNYKTAPRLTCSETVADFLRSKIDTLEHSEQFLCVFTTQSNKPIGWTVISKGATTATIVNFKAIFQMAILSNAVGIVLAHNHPSGNPAPSDADKLITERVKQLAKFLDMNLIDHLIITADDYFSFSDNGIL